MTVNALLNVENLKRHVMGDAEFLADQVDLFRGFYPQQLSLIRKGIETNDANEVREWAHQLAGSLSNFCSTAARDTAKAIEECGRNGDVARAAELEPRLERQIFELCEAAQQIADEWN